MNSRIVWIAALLLLASSANARPPSSGPTAEAPWFRGLQQPDGNGSCCDVSDCRRMPETDIRRSGDHYEYRYTRAVFGAYADDAWYPIPDTKWLKHKDNPTGFVVLCVLETMHEPSGGPLVLCAVKAYES